MHPPTAPSSPVAMLRLRRTGIVLASAAGLTALRIVSGSWLDRLLETRIPGCGNSLAEVAVCLLTVALIMSIPRLRRCVPWRAEWSWVVPVAAVFPLVNLVFLKAPEHAATVFSVTCLTLRGLATGIDEEIFLRGFAFAGNGEATPAFTVGVTALVFGLLHFFNLSTGAGTEQVIATVIFATWIGLLFGIIRIASGGLGWCAALHGVTNAAFEFTQSGTGAYQAAAAMSLLVTLPIGLILFFRHPAMRSTHSMRRAGRRPSLAEA